MKELLKRLAIKLTSTKALFGGAVLLVLCLVPLSAENAGVLVHLIYAVLGVKGLQYVTTAVEGLKGK